MSSIVRLTLICAVSVVLAACSGGKKEQDQRTAVGEILPGSVSDAMLPYDSVRSQPPLAPKAPGSVWGAGGTGEVDAAASDAAAPSDAEAPSAEVPPAPPPPPAE